MSSTEAEYVAMATCAMEMVFIKQVLESVDVKVKLPMTLYADNVAAIDLARNYSTNGRTKHIDIRHHYLRELVSDGIIKIEFVSSVDNTADILTQNLSEILYDNHSEGLGMVNNKSSIGEDVNSYHYASIVDILVHKQL